ncbi:MAG: hypothetical protein IPH08_04100 [Rhodocyclaceae bacterium]|nr:hypothetical protein [Rhodocyclaceae bacterium]
MKVKVQSTWSGSADSMFWTLATNDGHRFRLPAEPAGGWAVWRRSEARRALDLLVAEGYERRNIRFREV